MKTVILFSALLLAGCDTEEFERIREHSRVNEVFRINCQPIGKERVLVFWKDGNIVCHRYTDAGYGRAVNVERRVVAITDGDD